MKPLPLSLVEEISDGHLNEAACDLGLDTCVERFIVDSRDARPGDAFVAIAGEKVDGHDFAAAAVAAGATVVVSSRDLEGIPCLVTNDAVIALGRIAGCFRRQELSATVIAITGSSGKTTTKDLVADVLPGTVVAAEGSFNTEIGLPLTILAADASTDYLVLEMGMRGLGHISYLASIADPDIGVVLNVGSAHLGMMKDRSDIARAKAELVQALRPEAVAVLNADDPEVLAMVEVTHARVVRFGESSDAAIRASHVDVDDQGRPSFDLSCEGSAPVRVALEFHGEHFVGSALAAAAVGHVCGMREGDIARALNHARPRSRWRMEVRESRAGVVVINDAYNANPESVRAALKTLRSMGGSGRTWAVLGEMRELGEAALDEHDSVGRLAVRLDISRLVCVGQGTKAMHLAASNEGSWGEESVWVPDADAALELLKAELRPGDTVLVKASRAVGLESVAQGLLSEGGTE